MRDGLIRTIRPYRVRYFNHDDLIAAERTTAGRGIR